MAERRATESEGNPRGGIVEASTETWTEEVLNAPAPVLVYFWADWCEPCHEMRPSIARLAAECPDIKVVHLDIDNHEDIALTYRISIVPTIIVFRDGNKIHQSICVQSYDDIEASLEMLL